MPDGRWNEVGALLKEARKVPSAERSAFLKERCEETAIREEVASLLEGAHEASGFFDRLASAVPWPREAVQEAGEGNARELRASDPLDLEGERVGRYAVEEHLGGGGMGVVYRASDPELSRQVALKFLPPHLSAHEEAERRFVREAKTAAALEHPNIATVHEIGETEGGDRFIAMAYYEGETLKKKIERGPLPVEEALGYAEQIAEGLTRAHEAGIVHRDVKPANVMVTERGEVKLVDFGLARVAGQSRLTQPGRQLGTAAYLSPEQVEGEGVDRRADLWAFGVVLYEMLSGERPFRGERQPAVLHSILHDDPTPLGERRDDLSPTLEQVVGRCLRKDPEERYSSARTLLEDLRRLQAEAVPTVGDQLLGRSEEGSPTGPLSRIRRFVQELRRRRVLRLAAVYAGSGFVILQLGEILVGPFGLPGWTLRLLTFLLILGFPLAVGLAWVFDVTEKGLVRTRRRAASVGTATSGGKPFTSNGLIVGLLVIAIGLFLYPRVFPPEEERSLAGQSAPVDAVKVADRSIAVLPFEALGREEPGTFAEGMHGALLTRLSNISGLEVISRMSVEQYRDTDLPLPAIADSLGVKWVMEGGVQEMGDQIQVNTQLIDSRTDTHAWAESYRRELTAEDLFGIQSEITKKIARALEAELAPGEQHRVERRPTGDLEAYRLYVQGRTLLDRRTGRSIRQAAGYFRRAIARDSSYALAWAGLADTRSLLWLYGHAAADSVLPRALEAARQAVSLSPDLAEAHASLALVKDYRRDGPAAVREYKRALDLNPNYAQAHQWLGNLYLALGRLEEAVVHLEQAAELDPMSASIHTALAGAYNRERPPRLEASLSHTARAKELTPDYAAAHLVEGVALSRADQSEEALSALRQGIELAAPGDGVRRLHRGKPGVVHVRRGDTARARSYLDRLERKGESRYAQAEIHAALGEVGAAFADLRAVEWAKFLVAELRYGPALDSLRTDPRYRQLVREVNGKWGLNPDGSLPPTSTASRR